MATNIRQKALARRAKRQAEGPSARLRDLRMSARKVRLVVDLIRGQNIVQALHTLTFCRKAAAEPLAKLVRSAAANATQRGVADSAQLTIAKAFVDEGPTWKRFMPRAMGRSSKINKRTSHITIILGAA